jgi:GT2 family glycosyltransferase
VCVVDFEGGEPLLQLLTSLRGRAPLRVETIVVDNASRDETPVRVEIEHPEVRLIRNATNRGFAAANNQAAAVARGRHLLFLNNDTLPAPGALRALVRYLDEHRDVSAVGPVLVGADGRRQDAHGAAPTFWALLHRIRFLRWTGLFRAAYRAYRRSSPDHTGPVARLGGAAVLVRRQAFEAVGGWDEGYVFGLEDVDLSLRLAERGAVHVDAQVELLHTGGVSSARNPGFAYDGFERGYARHLAKHDPRPWVAPLWKLLVTLDQPLRLVELLLRAALGRRDAWRQAGAVLRFCAGLPGFWRGARTQG